MDELNVISLESAKDNLVVEGTEYDTRITALIRAAVNWIEVSTGWYLYKRNITIYSTDWKTKIIAYPATLGAVKNKDGVLLDPQPTPVYGALSFSVCCPPQSSIVLTVGPNDPQTELPGALIEAANKLIVYMYENKDMYAVTLPTDIQLLINPYRRSPTI